MKIILINCPLLSKTMVKENKVVSGTTFFGPQTFNMYCNTNTALLFCSYCGCSLYSVPSTPTVISRWSSPLFSRILSTTAAIPAPQIWAARRDTVPHTSLTIILSSQVLSSPSCCRIALTCSSARRSLWSRGGGGRVRGCQRSANSRRVTRYLTAVPGG